MTLLLPLRESQNNKLTFKPIHPQERPPAMLTAWQARKWARMSLVENAVLCDLSGLA